MALFVTVPISTEVIESNPDCALSGAYENGVLVITIDNRGQNVHQRLGLGTKTRLHWGAEHRFEVKELSGLTWPIRYRVITRDGYYLQKSQRAHLTTSARGLDAHRGVSEVVMRAAADEQIGRLRAFLGGVRNIFEDSQHEEQARAGAGQLETDAAGSTPFDAL